MFDSLIPPGPYTNTCNTVSSEDDDDDIFSDDLAERVSDSESPGEEQVSHSLYSLYTYYY